MYRDLGCQHHLVQKRNDQRPNIPGLTPAGFERWATLLIHAYPEEEYTRLNKAVLDMPISNPDKRERFPKEIPRRLFLAHGNRRIRNRIEDAILNYTAVGHPRRPSSEDPQSLPPPKPRIPRQASPLQHHRHRRVSFVLPSKSVSDSTYTPAHLECGRESCSTTRSYTPVFRQELV